MRGLPLTDYRSRLLYAFAASAAWFVSSEQQLEVELVAFAHDHFDGGRRYGLRQVQTVVDRLRLDRQGLPRIWNGQRIANRYRLSNAYLIRLLDVSAAEQQQLKTVIGPDERQRRRVERRRAAGMVDRAARASDRAQRAAELREQGLPRPAIASELGVTVRHVSRLFKGRG